ncbi:thioredoxin domain-containing protein, partial [bacterium]
LNEHFVSIKVDREERPDIDTIYMSVCQAMTGHGGWPLTIVMTPDKKPFFAGTYFPKNNARGMPGLMNILNRIAHLWQNNKDELVASGDKITEAVENSLFAQSKGDITREVLDRAYAYYEKNFDSGYGGFGSAPKFPTPHNLSFLLRYWKMTGSRRALEMVEKTLEAMYRGGIYDHIGFGFARYSTDRRWLVPHFEKMLYDNALLAIAYLEAFQAAGRDLYARAAREIFTYVLRDMTSPEGAFYSAEDADSEGEEGKFYVWDPEEVKEILGPQPGGRFCRDYDISSRGNFEGKSIPNLIGTGLVDGYGEAREKLFRHREKRVHPFKDDKILTAWNGLMIAALAFGARVLGDDRYMQAAEKAVEFIMSHLRREDGRLLARYRDGEAAYLAYVDDYAFLIWGLIELHQATSKHVYLEQALKLNNNMLKYFWDEEHGGLYQYGSDAETLISRPKEIYDGALPSGNSVAAVNFLRLARLAGDTGLEETAQKQLKAFGGTVSETPPGHAHFLMAVYLNETPPVEVTVAGDPQAADTQEMISIVNSGFRPETLLQVNPADTAKKAVDGKAAAYVCRDFTCHPPVTGPQELARLLQ